MNYPKITIVTPSFNQAHFLEETIRSVVQQDYPNLEYIVMDGGSTDESVRIIRKYESAISFWVSEKDSGPADAINKGFAKATGSIIAYLNSDDVYMPGTLKAVAEAFESDPSADVVYGNTHWIGRNGERLGEKRQTPFFRLGYLYGGSDLQQPSTFWKREVFLKAGQLDTKWRAIYDTDLFFRFVSVGAKFKYVDRPFSSFRVHSDQISDVMFARAQSELNTLRTKHLAHPINSLTARVFRNAARLKRMCWYIWHGDAFWLVGRIPDRLKSRTSNHATGPRSKWV